MKDRSFFSSGFTLIEIITTISILLLILSIGVPYGLRYFRSERLNSTSRNLLEILRLAQTYALSQKYDSDFGVSIQTDKFVFFKGENYANRDSSFDQVFDFSDQIKISGISEVVFSKLTGLPNNLGSITLTGGNSSNVIQINSRGLISLDINASLTTS